MAYSALKEQQIVIADECTRFARWPLRAVVADSPRNRLSLRQSRCAKHVSVQPSSNRQVT